MIWLLGNAKTCVHGEDSYPEECASYEAWPLLKSVPLPAPGSLPQLGYVTAAVHISMMVFNLGGLGGSEGLAGDVHLGSIRIVVSCDWTKRWI